MTRYTITGYYLHNGTKSALVPCEIHTDDKDVTRRKIMQENAGKDVYLVVRDNYLLHPRK